MRPSRSSGRAGVRAFVVPLHQGASEHHLLPGPFTSPPNPAGYTDVNGGVSFGGTEIKAIAAGVDSRVDVIVSGQTTALHLPELRRTGSSSRAPLRSVA